MIKEEDFLNAVRKAIELSGNEVKLGTKIGIDRAVINRIKNKKTPIDNITVGTLRKMFPDMQIDFFGTAGQKGYSAKIIKMLNQLSDDEQLELMLAIAAKYPRSVEPLK
jgi:transcriptional regulator with XRE-family HTH domain